MIFLAKYYLSQNQNNIIFNLHADKEETNNLNHKKRIEIYSRVGFHININTIIELDNNKKATIVKKIIDDKDKNFRYYINDENENKYIIDSNQIDKCLTHNIDYTGFKVSDKYAKYNNLINNSCPMTTTPELILKFNSI